MAALQARHTEDFLFARFNQIGLWENLQAGTWLPFGGVSAMPSVHVAMATLIAIVAKAQNRTAGLLLTIFAGLTMLGSVVLGWHYAIDGYLGIAMALAIWRLVPSRSFPRP
jgi:membrane-associated phospholipid phosphatase